MQEKLGAALGKFGDNELLISTFAAKFDKMRSTVDDSLS
jgi:hypothetical protein